MRPARRWLVPPVAALAALGLAVVWQQGRDGAGADPGPVHVHGLGLNSADGALFIATHSGLYRLDPAGARAERVGDRLQDIMGFTVAGPDHFFGSGHPDPRDDLPPLLGLIESRDAGASWTPISLLGEADLHVLRTAGELVYGYDAANDRLLVSFDRGRTWSERGLPGPIVDLAPDPEDARRAVAATGDGLAESKDAGATWSRLGRATGLLAWPSVDRLYLLDHAGRLFRSRDGGRRLELRGQVGAEPAAFVAASAEELFVALHDGTIVRSADGGETWDVRARP